jgi:MFS transporter, DHA2 family, multidrug resistance protein
MVMYMDGLKVSPQNVMTNMETIQLNAIISSNKKIFGYIILAGFGILIYVSTHHFGEENSNIQD